MARSSEGPNATLRAMLAAHAGHEPLVNGVVGCFYHDTFAEQDVCNWLAGARALGIDLPALLADSDALGKIAAIVEADGLPHCKCNGRIQEVLRER